jgi:hypothetical protein
MRHKKPTMKKPYGVTIMKTRYGILFSLVTLAMLSCVGIAAAAPATPSGTQTASADTIASYNGQIGPGNSLYGLRIAFENLDESFTFNQSEKLAKQVSHADLRLSELEQELADNRTTTAEIALEQYRQKLNQTEETLEPFSRNETGPRFAANDTGLSHAQEMITKHQQVLEDLLQAHPDNQGLAQAYNNSVVLEEKFNLKMETRHQYQGGDDNSTFVPPQDMNQTMNRFGPNQSRLSGNFTGEFPQDMNQTMNRFGPNQSRLSGNFTGEFPQDMNQTANRFGPNQSRLSGNFTGEFPQDMNQTANRNGNGPDGQSDNQTQGPSQQPGNPSGNGQSQNNNGNAGNSQNNNNNQNVNSGGNGNNNNFVNPQNGAGNQNNNANTGTGTNNNKGNTGTTSSGNIPGSTRSSGR